MPATLSSSGCYGQVVTASAPALGEPAARDLGYPSGDPGHVRCWSTSEADTTSTETAVIAHQTIFQLAERQLPLAAISGLGDELAAVAEALHEQERVIRLAIAHDGHALGVVALTDSRVLWSAGVSFAPGTVVLAWPRGRVSVTSADDGNACAEAGDVRW